MTTTLTTLTTLTTQDKLTIRTAANGAVMLVTIADVAGSPSRVAAAGVLSFAAATGTIGHVLAEKMKDTKLNYKSGAALADQVLPALTKSVSLLKNQDPAEADNFRKVVLIAVEAATQRHKGEPSPTIAEMTRKITEALDAA